MTDERLEASQDATGGEFDLASFMESRAAESASDDAPPTTEAEQTQEPQQQDPASTAPQAETEAQAEPEPTPLEPQDNAERSRLGREVKALKTQLEQQAQQTELLMQILMAQADPAKQQQQAVDEDDFIPTTKREMAQFVKQQMMQEVQAKQTEQQQYANAYFKELKSLNSKDEEDVPADVINEAVKLCTQPGQPYYRYTYGHGAADARMNYLEAKAYVLQQRLSKPKPKEVPLANQPPKAPLGDGPTGTATAKEVKLTKLDKGIREQARRAAEAFGLDLASMGYEA